jgi:hypothetical protein
MQIRYLADLSRLASLSKVLHLKSVYKYFLYRDMCILCVCVYSFTISGVNINIYIYTYSGVMKWKRRTKGTTQPQETHTLSLTKWKVKETELDEAMLPESVNHIDKPPVEGIELEENKVPARFTLPKPYIVYSDSVIIIIIIIIHLLFDMS